MSPAGWLTLGLLAFALLALVYARLHAPRCPACRSRATERVVHSKWVCRACGHGWHNTPKER